MFRKINVVKNCAKFRGKHLCQGLELNKVAGCKNFSKFLGKHLGWNSAFMLQMMMMIVRKVPPHATFLALISRYFFPYKTRKPHKDSSCIKLFESFIPFPLLSSNLIGLGADWVLCMVFHWFLVFLVCLLRYGLETPIQTIIILATAATVRFRGRF